MFCKLKNKIYTIVFITLLGFLILYPENSYLQNNLRSLTYAKTVDNVYNMYDTEKFHYVIIGNSITRHGGGDDWPEERGMAATRDDKDYVRVLEKLFKADGIPDVEYTVEPYYPHDINSARNFTSRKTDHLFGDDIDLIIIQIGENILPDAPITEYQEVYTEMIKKLKSQMQKAQVIIIDSMYSSEGVTYTLSKIASDTGSIFMPIDMIKTDDTYRSFIGDKVYDNDGNAYEISNVAIAVHPNDKGHKYIAEQIHNICVNHIFLKNKADKNVNVTSAIDNIEENDYLSCVDHLGDTTRVKRFLNKARAGASLTIVGLGGSITAGAGLTYEGMDIPFGEKFTNALRAKYPNSNFKYVNAGISGTNLTYSVCRVKDDCIKYNPDLVILDFSVNTRDDKDVENLYSSIVSQINKANEETAIVNIHFTEAMENRDSNVIGKQGQLNLVSNTQILNAVVSFDLPSVSYHSFVWKEIENNVITQNDIFQDYVHPTQYGHHIASSLLIKLFEYIDRSQDSANIKPMKKLTSDAYANAEYITHVPNSAYQSNERGHDFFIDDFSANQLISYKGWRSISTDKTGLIDFNLASNKTVVIGLQFFGAKGFITIAGKSPNGDIYQIDRISAPETGLFTTVSYENVKDYIGIMTNLTEGYVVIYGIGIIR